MSIAAIVSLVLIGLLVAALAFYLIWVVVILHRAVGTLGKVTFGVRAIALRTEPLGELLGDVNTNLTAVAGALEQLVAEVSEPAAQAHLVIAPSLRSQGTPDGSATCGGSTATTPRTDPSRVSAPARAQPQTGQGGWPGAH